MIAPGQRVGHIAIQEHLAAGAMGEVFVGFDERLRRRVALKAVHADLWSARRRERFLEEARALSRLDHPSICRIYEYLEGEDGDFLVLELIRGRTLRQALIQQASNQPLDRRARLRIAEQVARALAAAHEAGVVHGDLKPGNVMLTARGDAKVLDFGLAESTASGTGRDTPGTARSPWSVVGTPAGMSPEQARGERATAASDAYSLGLLLQELATGRPPYEPGIPAPLLLVKAADGDTLPLAGVGDADLSALIRRLLSLAPEARPTAAAAAERLAWIRGKPARRRRRLLAAALAATFLLGGVQYTLDLRRERQAAQEARRRAEREAARAEAVAGFLEGLFQAADPRRARGEPPGARELLARGTARLGKDLAAQPLLHARLLDTLGTLHTQLGLYDEARPLLEQALAIRRRLLGEADLATAETLAHLGAVASLSGKGDPVPPLRRALAIRAARLGIESPEVADGLNNLGTALAARGRLDAAEAVLRRALALDEKLWGARDLRAAKVLHNLSGIAFHRGRAAEAEALVRRALAIREAALPADDLDLAGSREALGIFLRGAGKPAAAAELLAPAAATAERVYGPAHPELARVLYNLGLARADLHQEDDADRLLARALAIDERALSPASPLLARMIVAVADLRAEWGRYAAAEPLYRRALALRQAALPPGDPLVVEVRERLAALQRRERRPPEAR